MERECYWPIRRWRAICLGAPVVLAGMLCTVLLCVLQGAALAHGNLEGTLQSEPPELAAIGASQGGLRAGRSGNKELSIIAGSAFTFAMSGDAQGLDPSLEVDGLSFLVARQIYDNLVNYQPGGTAPVPGLAENWSVSADGLTWTFKLCSGVKFHDGTDVDAAAVLYNLERWWDPAHPYHDGSFEYFEYMFGGFRGDPDCLISDLGTIGTDQVQIILTEPRSPLPNTLAMPPFAIASPAAIQVGTLSTTPVGSGPFKFVEWAPGDYIRLVGNTAYWGDGPRLETLVFRAVPEDAARLAALQSNRVQGAGLAWSYIPTATLDANLKVLWRPALNTGYLGINRSHSPLDNLLVRQAIAHAIDKESIVANHYNADAEGGQVAQQLLPPMMWGRDDDLVDYAYDPAQARSLLAQAGYTDGFTTTLWVMPVERFYFPNPTDVAASMQADLQAVGITATQVTYDWGTYLSKIRNGEADLFMLGWGSDNGHPDDFFYLLLCAGYQRYGPRDDALCGLLQAAREERDFDAQVLIYEWASRRVHDTLPLLPIGHSRTSLVLRRDVAGFVPTPVGFESFKDVFFVSWVYLPLTLRSFGP